jgi:hypothetical protein
MSIGGKILTGLATAGYGFDAADNAMKGDVGNAVGSTGMMAAPFAGPVGIGAMVADGASRMTTGKSLTDWIGTGVAKAFGPKETSMLTPEFQKTVDVAGGPEKYAASLKAPAAAPTSAPAPAPAAVAPAQAPTLERITGPAGATIAQGVHNRDITLADVPRGGGYVVGPKGQVTRINAPAPEQPAAPTKMSDRDALVASLRDGMLNGRNGRARRDAAGRLASVLDNEMHRETDRMVAENNIRKMNADIIKESNADRNAQRDSIQKRLEERFITQGKDGAVPDKEAISDFKRRAQFTVKAATSNALDVLRSKDASPEQKREAQITLSKFAMPTKDGAAAPLEFEQLGTPAMEELLRLNDLRSRVKEKSEVGKRDIASIAAGAGAGAYAGLKARGGPGAAVGAVVGGIGGAGFGASQRGQYVDDDNLFNYRTYADGSTARTLNGGKIHTGDLSTVEGHNWVLPQIFYTPDRKFDDPNLRVKKP